MIIEYIIVSFHPPIWLRTAFFSVRRLPFLSSFTIILVSFLPASEVCDCFLGCCRCCYISCCCRLCFALVSDPLFFSSFGCFLNCFVGWLSIPVCLTISVSDEHFLLQLSYNCNTSSVIHLFFLTLALPRTSFVCKFSTTTLLCKVTKGGLEFYRNIFEALAHQLSTSCSLFCTRPWHKKQLWLITTYMCLISIATVYRWEKRLQTSCDWLEDLQMYDWFR